MAVRALLNLLLIAGWLAVATWGSGEPLARAVPELRNQAQESFNVDLVGRISGWSRGVAVRDGYAYVAGSWSGFRVISVSDPANPVEVARYPTSQPAMDVALYGPYAYVAAGDGLRIIDVSVPSAPRQVGFYPVPGSAGRVALSIPYVYVATGFAGVRILDVSNPASPLEVGSYSRPQAGWQLSGVAAAGTYVYVVGTDTEFPTRGQGGLRVIDVSTPARPREVAFYRTTESVDLATYGSRAYVSDYVPGLDIISVADPLLPAGLGSYHPEAPAHGVAAYGAYVYLATSNGLHVLDVSTPASPREVGFYATSPYPLRVTLLGPYMYLSHLEEADGLSILRFSGAPAGGTRQAFVPNIFKGTAAW